MNTISKLIALLIFALIALNASALPSRPAPAALVNNFSQQYPSFLSTSETEALEEKLSNFAASSSNQIAIVIVDTLEGREINEYATALFNEWGVGQKKTNNGVLILIKPTQEEGGRRVYISTGYGTEGSVPDITCKQIIDKDIIPLLKAGQNYKALDVSTTKIMNLVLDDFNESVNNSKQNSASSFATLLLIGIFLLISVNEFFSRKSNGYTLSRHGYSNYNSGFYILPAMFGSNRRFHTGNFGGGFGGSFGGFGGGSSGGGGAGGSW